MLNKKTIDDLDLRDKKVLVRCDFNVPLLESNITDDTRIRAALPTINKLLDAHSKIILCSHLGKPKLADKKFSLAPVVNVLAKLLGHEIIFAADDLVTSMQTRDRVANLKSGKIILLENTRFRQEETKNLDSFSQELAALAEIYINDAFGSAHRAHCSTHGVTKFMRETAVGYLMQKELNFLGKALDNPKRPFVAILGGAKISDKIGVIDSLLNKVDKLIIGGGMAYTFLMAQGFGVGKSLLESDKLEYARTIIQKARDKNIELLLPLDTVVVKEFKFDAEFRTVLSNQIPDDYLGVDIGEQSRQLFANALSNAKTVLWNGPMGVFEFENFARGTFAIAKKLSELNAITIIGGGDSAAAINLLGFADKITHISTGGGASLEFLEGKELPGIAAIQDKI